MSNKRYCEFCILVILLLDFADATLEEYYSSLLAGLERFTRNFYSAQEKEIMSREIPKGWELLFTKAEIDQTIDAH